MADLGIAFLEGLLSALSACVYPLIPITTALFLGGESKSFLRGLGLSSIYIAGMSITYVSLGLIAALSGQVFGSYLGNPWVVSSFAIFFFILGLAFMEVIPLRFTFATQIQVKNRGKFLYPLLLGIFSGFIAAPCTAPLFGAVLLDIATKAAEHESLIPGISKAFAFSLGIGFPFLWIGAFALKLPKPGPWLKAVKYLGAVVLFTAGLHYFDDISGSLVGAGQKTAAAIAGFFIFALFFMLAEPLKPEEGSIKEMKKEKRQAAVLLFIAAFGLYLATLPFATSIGALAKDKVKAAKTITDKNGLFWFQDLDLALQKASEKNILLVDLWADWCEACHEMEEQLFPSPDFQSLLKRYHLILVRVDFTEETEKNTKIAEKYKIRGLPTLLLLNEEGKLLGKVVGFMNTAQAVTEIKRQLGSKNTP
ncbi:MAG: hypothetical protein D6767_01750 [Candidatus Hydrogenedentota bacterium]|nr:MAG: hypothetical protein D6767_01750 [Candidatus Hydrogenedentota bacterium]